MCENDYYLRSFYIWLFTMSDDLPQNSLSNFFLNQNISLVLLNVSTDPPHVTNCVPALWSVERPLKRPSGRRSVGDR